MNNVLKEKKKRRRSVESAAEVNGASVINSDSNHCNKINVCD